MSIEKTNKEESILTPNSVTKSDNPLDEIVDIEQDLPKLLEKLLKRFNGREKEIVLLSSLGVLSSCMPNIYGYYDGHVVYPNLYILIIAPAASLKGAMNYSRPLIEKIHAFLLKNSQGNSNSKASNKRAIIKLLPANTSSAEIYAYMNSSIDGVLIFESEADTLSKMFKNDWSNYSDILRKAFHHEAMTMARKGDNVFLEVKEPKLSLVISGTPEQLKPLIISTENGLFSRFLIYSFDDITPFKDVFEKKLNIRLNDFENAGNLILELYKKLSKRTTKIQFKFTEEQEKSFFKEFTSLQSNMINNQSDELLPNMRRHGLIMFRICMIITVLRSMDSINDVTELICSEADYQTGIKIIKQSLNDLMENYTYIGDGRLSKQDDDLLFSVKENFTRQELIESGKKQNIPVRTIDDKIKQWRKKKVIIKVGHGSFKRSNK
ncbi:MAG: DUF3987 domain-containing protein [Bacteroidota bacterium]